MVQLKAKGDDLDSSADRKDVDFVTPVGQTQATGPARYAKKKVRNLPSSLNLITQSLQSGKTSEPVHCATVFDAYIPSDVDSPIVVPLETNDVEM